MPNLTQFGLRTSLPFEELRQISERQILNTSSSAYKILVEKVANKWNLQAMQEVQTAKVVSRRRVYVPQSLASDIKYKLSLAFPQFDIVYVTPTKTSAAQARAVSLLVSEFMLHMGPSREKAVMLYGFSLRVALMRNRHYARVHFAGGDPAVQAIVKSEDRECEIIYDSMRNKRKKVPDALEDHITGQHAVLCSSAHSCSCNGGVVMVMLDGYNTNYRQICNLMYDKRARIAYVALPYSPHMECGTEGDFPELGGYVVHTGIGNTAQCHVMFRDDAQNQITFDRSNFIELLARTRAHIAGNTYMKEFVTHVQGYNVYKITSTPGRFSDALAPYKSWIIPEYRRMYIVKVPRLIEGGNAHVARDWNMETVIIRKSVVDDVLAPVLSANGDKLDDLVIRRLFSKAHMYIASGQLTRPESPLTVQQFVNAFILMYVVAFMRKFHSGSVVAALAPAARNAVRASNAGWGASLTALLSSFGDKVYDATLASVVSGMRSYAGAIRARHDIPLPSYHEAEGYLSYDQLDPYADGVGWYDSTLGPTAGFTPGLPGCGAAFQSVVNQAALASDRALANIQFEDIVGKPTIMDRFSKVATSFRRVGVGIDMDFDAMYPQDFAHATHPEGELKDNRYQDVNRQSSDDISLPVKRVLRPVHDELRFVPMRQRQIIKELDPQSRTAETDIILSKMFDQVIVGDGVPVPVVFNAYQAPRPDLSVSSGAVSIDPVGDLRDAIMILFPKSLAMDTSNVEAERAYGDSHIQMRTLYAKIDVSRMEALKPEQLFAPILRGHVLPNIKNSTVNTVSTLAKRNADTPYVKIAVNEDELWRRICVAMGDVYFVDHAYDWLKTQPDILPTEPNIREWLFKQDKTKLARLMQDENGFAFTDMIFNVRNSHLMLKGKLKPEMDASYSTAVKLPQSIQYDPTGASVAVLSPAFRDLVKREQFMLRPNVMVLQRKSPDDVVAFLNMFDHRPDDRGERTYIEIDETLFDKSQVREIAVMYLKYLELIGLRDDYIRFIEEMFTRNVSSMKAGVKMALRDQNVSGATFTLHRNNAVSMIILALALQRIKDQIEFIIIMGDDVTVAVRGAVDVGDWEAELSRMFNMSAKIRMHQHGYICSQDIVHRADGTTTLTRDSVKAGLSLMQQSLSEEDKFGELHESFADSMKYIDDLATQEYLLPALTARWKETLPTATPEAFHLLLKALSAVKQDKSALRKFYSEHKHTRFY